MVDHRKIGVILAVLGTATVVWFGVRAATRFTHRPSRLEPTPISQPLRVITDPYTPAFVEVSEQDRQALEATLEAEARQALLRLEGVERPTETDARAIASVFAEFVTICRAGAPEEHAAMVRSRGREVDPRFLDPDRKDGFWKTNTGWAREAPLGTEGIWARARYLRGTEVPINPNRIRDGGGSIRPFRNNKVFMEKGHQYTVYEIILPATLVSVEGNRVDGAVGIMIADDAANGGWDTVGVFSLGVPQGFIIFMTPP